MSKGFSDALDSTHDELRLAAIAIKMISVPTTRPPEVSPRTSQIQVCMCASIYWMYAYWLSTGMPQ